MQEFLDMMASLMQFFYIEIDLYGFVFRFIDIVLYTAVAIIVIRLAMFIFRNED